MNQKLLELIGIQEQQAVRPKKFIHPPPPPPPPPPPNGISVSFQIHEQKETEPHQKEVTLPFQERERCLDIQ